MSDWTPTSDKRTLLAAADVRGLNVKELAEQTNLEIVDVLTEVDEYTAEQNAETGEPDLSHLSSENVAADVEQALAGAEATDPEGEDEVDDFGPDDDDPEADDFTEGWDEEDDDDEDDDPEVVGDDDDWEDGEVLRFVLTMGSKVEKGVVAAEFRDELEAKAKTLKGAKIEFAPAAVEGDKVCITSLGSRSGVVTQVTGHRCRVELDGPAKIGGSVVSKVAIDRGECAVVS